MNYRILLLDDDPAMSKIYVAGLFAAASALGITYQIVTVRSAAAAKLQASRQPFAAAVATLSSESNAGLELAQSLRQLYPRMPFVLIRDRNAPTTQVSRALQMGVRVIDQVRAERQLGIIISHLLGIHVPLSRAPERDLSDPPPPPLPAPLPLEQGARVFSASQMRDIKTNLAQLGGLPGVRCALLADMSGQEVASWKGISNVDTPGVAALAASELLASVEIGQILGGYRSCNLIVQEHDEQMVLMARVGEDMLLLLATENDAPIGPSRLAIKRTSDRLFAIADNDADRRNQAVQAQPGFGSGYSSVQS